MLNKGLEKLSKHTKSKNELKCSLMKHSAGISKSYGYRLQTAEVFINKTIFLYIEFRKPLFKFKRTITNYDNNDS